jgi:predicted DNA-binding transcriptional regulator AlpA
MTQTRRNGSRRGDGPVRGLNMQESAEYIGVGETKFGQLVDSGRMPPPKRIDGRKVWDIRELDEAFERLPSDGCAAGHGNPWMED